MTITIEYGDDFTVISATRGDKHIMHATVTDAGTVVHVNNGTALLNNAEFADFCNQVNRSVEQF